MSATALKSTKRRFSSLNHQNFEFFRLVSRSPTHTGLICGKTLEPNISSLGPFKSPMSNYLDWLQLRWNYSSNTGLYPHWFHQCASGSSIFGQCASGSRDFFYHNLYNFEVQKMLLLLFASKTAIYLSIGLHPPWRTSKLQENGLQSSKENFQYFKIIRMWYIYIIFYAHEPPGDLNGVYPREV